MFIEWMFKSGLWISAVAAAMLLTVSSRGGESERQRTIDFEDSIVEGMNKRPLDSLSQLSDKNGGKERPHLYRKRAGFRPEIRESVIESRFIQ